jgi:hypothetical protein
VKTPTQLSPLERDNLNNWTKTDPASETSRFLVSRIPDDGKSPKPSNSVCYTPSSEPFRIYCTSYLDNELIKDTRSSRKGSEDNTVGEILLCNGVYFCLRTFVFPRIRSTLRIHFQGFSALRERELPKWADCEKT